MSNIYILKTKKDFEILDLCKKLEKCRMPNNDKELVHLIKTQLKKDWRTPLLRILNKLSKKYELETEFH